MSISWTSIARVYRANESPPLDRRITSTEFTEAVNLALKAGLTRLDGMTLKKETYF
jgi:uncharacterized Fe-S radical SAM superfamily protein PflX